MVGNYVIAARLGRGFEGSVYLAVHRQTAQFWALKQIRPDRCGKEGGEDASADTYELHMYRKLHHPSLPMIVEEISTPEGNFLVMEYIRGRNLQQIMDREKHLDTERVLDIGISLCGTLTYLHTREEPILHLDLKPANIIIHPNGRIMLVDMGASRRCADREQNRIRFGTPGFAAPEQYDIRRKLTPATDIYSLGAVLYYLISGVLFSDRCIKSKIPGCPDALGKVILKALAAKPEDRYTSAREFEGALKKVKKELGGEKKRICMEGAALLVILCTYLAFRTVGSALPDIADFMKNQLQPPDTKLETQVQSEMMG